MAAMAISNALTGFPPRGSLRAKRTSTSEAVMRTPAHKGSFGKRRQRAIADPSSSARSVAMMAISDRA